MSILPSSLASRLLAWFDQHGRKNLPWQQNPTLYRVWVSEIMLQQTQVATVIPYYQRFMARFPNVAQLASASLDEVLALWSGLGYYARGRNLHRAAGIIRDMYDGHFPDDFSIVVTLPGIGRSTAGAILALALGQRHPILDGNVRRVLARHRGIPGWPGERAVEHALWQQAEQHTPYERVAAYTQALMDLGATVCTRTRPRCRACPLAADCVAYRDNRQTELPGTRPRPLLPVRTVRFLVLRDATGAIYFTRRPPVGIWGGLWTLPECALEDDVATWCRERLGMDVAEIQTHVPWRHTFSHYHLDIHPSLAQVTAIRAVMDAAHSVWYNPHHIAQLGVPAPVRRLIAQLRYPP